MQNFSFNTDNVSIVSTPIIPSMYDSPCISPNLNSTFKITEETDFVIGDLTIPGKHLKVMMKTLLEISKQKHPEEFI